MKKPSGRRLLLFVILSVVYACFATFVIFMAAISTCPMQADIAATCDVATTTFATIGVGLLYVACAVWFFRAKLDGVD
jgi:hypothetical protein